MKNQIKIKHDLVEENGVYYLNRNGQNTICPFRSPVPIPVQNNITGETSVGFQSIPCCSQCPLFEIRTGIDSGLLVEICSNGNISIDEFIQRKQSPLTKL